MDRLLIVPHMIISSACNNILSHAISVMADMMAGQWYARSCGLPPVLPEGQELGTPVHSNVHSRNAPNGTSGSSDGVGEMALSCFRTIFDCNVVRFSDIARR